MKITKIFGPPGTGKTTRLLAIMERELEAGVPAKRLAYLTFTVAARKEAQTRAAAKFVTEPGDLKWFRTLHSAAYELLAIKKDAIITNLGGTDFGTRFGYEFEVEESFSDEGLPRFGYGEGDRLLAFDHFDRHKLLGIDAAWRRFDESRLTLLQAKRFREAYRQWKTDEGYVDFTDLLEQVTDVVLPCDVVIVDEAQDLSPLQWVAFWRLARDAERVYIAGDDDQAIYEWAGASPESFLSQPGDVEVLPQSYRCPTEVTKLAHSIISRVHLRQPKVWKSRDVAGEVTWRSYTDQATVPGVGSALWLFRNHKFATELVELLKQQGTVFTYRGKRSIPAEAASAIVHWQRLVRGDSVPGTEIENILKHATLRSIPAAARQAFRAGDVNAGWSADQLGWPKEIPWFGILDKLKKDEFYIRKIIQQGGAKALIAPPRVTLTTIHGAKGAEADHVTLFTDMTNAVQASYDRDPDPERRVWYVGVTRARETLTLVGPGNPVL